MGAPLAYFLTWTTYGTWLHGYGRGAVDRDHNQYGEPYLEPAEGLRQYETKQLKQAPVQLNPRQRDLVETIIRQDCHYRGYHLFALNCRSNHIHVVVRTQDVPAERVMTQFKSYVTRGLREMGSFSGEKVWTAGGSKRFLFT
jgi:hypothetical protein